MCVASGPDLLRTNHASETVEWNYGGCEQDRAVTLSSHSNLPLEHDIASMEALKTIDLVVLFNPGFGHPALLQHWARALDMLLTCSAPLLCTALSVYL